MSRHGSHDDTPETSRLVRREFLRGLGVLAVAAALAPVSSIPAAASTSPGTARYLRPPGARAEADFLHRCIRCGQCGAVCPNRAISYLDLSQGLQALDTPFLVAREQACILCMKCGDICPSGAIEPIPRTGEAVMARVKMGQAVVDKNLCLSYQGKTCGVCYRACPLQDVAIRVGMLEQPEVSEACVGCGLCERSCIQMPQAIRVFPNRDGV